MKVVILRPAAPWLAPEIREQGVELRRCERRWRTTGLTVHREAYAQKSVVMNNLISCAKKTYSSELISACGTDQKELFGIVQSPNSGSTEKQFPHVRTAEVLANQFAEFFESKVIIIRRDLLQRSTQVIDPLPDSSLPECGSTFDGFKPVTCNEFSSLVKKIAAKYCSVDPIPANVLISCFDTLLPVIKKIVNT